MNATAVTSLPAKLGIREESTLALLSAPDGFDAALTPLPAGATVKRQARGSADVVVFFTTERTRLEAKLERLGEMIFPAGGLWIAWPKRASKVPTDMTEDVVRALALPLGLVDNKVAAIDQTWSGLRLVWRKELR